MYNTEAYLFSIVHFSHLRNIATRIVNFVGTTLKFMTKYVFLCIFIGVYRMRSIHLRVINVSILVGSLLTILNLYSDWRSQITIARGEMGRRG